MAEQVTTKFWRGTVLPDEIVDGRVYYLYENENSPRFTLYVDHKGVRSKITDGNKYKVFKLLPDKWTGVADDGGRRWVTQSFPISGCYTHVISAIPCGETSSIMATKEQEEAVGNMRGWIEEANNGDLFVTIYSPVAPSIDVYMGIEGVF